MVPSVGRVVGTLTTLPTRYNRLEKTLKSLHNQHHRLDAIYLGLPKRAVRLGLDYPDLPSNISSLCTVVPCEDKGPITKLSGALLTETDPQTLIISFDDDRTYHPNTVTALLQAYKKNPKVVICTTGILIGYHPFAHAYHTNAKDYAVYPYMGFLIPPEGRPIDIVSGFTGVLYQRSFFPSVDKLEELWYYTTLDKELFRNDDTTISGYLSLKGIKRVVVNTRHKMPGLHEDLPGANAITFGLTSMSNSVTIAKTIGMFSEPEPVSLTETTTFRAIIIVIIILILILLVVASYQYFLSP